MSDERLEQLGLPRRGFLKKTAAIAFAAPAIVSFGLDGTAEATPTICVANSTYYPNQSYEAEEYLIDVIGGAFTALRNGQTTIQAVNQVSQAALQAALDLAAGNSQAACQVISGLIGEIEMYRLPTLMLDDARSAQELACGCDAG